MSDDAKRWPLVSRERPCPKCGKADRCTIAPDGRAGRCWRDNGGTTWHAPPDPNKRPARTRQTSEPTTKRNAPRVYPTLAAAVTAIRLSIRGATTAGDPWLYRDTNDGAIVMAVARFDLPARLGGKPDKTCRPFTPADGNATGDVAGPWHAGDPPRRPLPLYRLDELSGAQASQRVYIVEGEKCADALASIGLLATTSSHGASAAEKTDWSLLAGRADVVLLPDRDAAGERYAADVARLLVALRPPPLSIRVVRLDDPRDPAATPEGFDVADWIDARDGDEPVALAAAIDAMADAADGAAEGPADDNEDDDEAPVVVNLADVTAQPVRWLWPGRLVIGKLTMVVGAPGGGKSFFTIDAAARVTTGTPWPDGSACPIGGVLIANAEDDPADTIRPRFDACRGDPTRVRVCTLVRDRDERGRQRERMLSLADLRHIGSAIDQTPDCRLLIIDPAGSFIGGRTDAHRDNEVRAVLAPLAQLAEAKGVAVLIVMHTRKSGGGSADERALGSRAFVGIARVVLHLLPDPADPERRLLLPGKSNLARAGHGLAFRIVGDDANAAPAWEREPVKMTADEAYRAIDANAGNEPGDEGEGEGEGDADSALFDAMRFLAQLLLDGPRPCGDRRKPEPGTIRAEAVAAVVKERTLERAKDRLKVKASKEPGGWHWRLPRDGANAYVVPDEVRRSLEEDAADPPDGGDVAHKAHIHGEPLNTGDPPVDAEEVRQERHAADVGADYGESGAADVD